MSKLDALRKRIVILSKEFQEVSKDLEGKRIKVVRARNRPYSLEGKVFTIRLVYFQDYGPASDTQPMISFDAGAVRFLNLDEVEFVSEFTED